jgi:hypothetical protein
MFKSILRFVLIVIVAQIISYYIAGVIAQLALGAGQFYPPSPHAISYLRDPHDPRLQLVILPAQALRGLLFGVALFPFRERIQSLGKWFGMLAVAGVIFLAGFVAASGGLIEHFVYFNEYPALFAAITFVEVLIQSLLMGLIIVRWDKPGQRSVKS